MKKMQWRDTRIINEIIIHHSGSDTDNVASIRAAHLRNGWCEVGYHYIIKAGCVYECRKLQYVGAHCYGHNKRSIGVCVCGDYTNKQISIDDYYLLTKLISNLCVRFCILKVSFHNDYAKTLCPGNIVKFRRIFDNIRSHTYSSYDNV